MYIDPMLLDDLKEPFESQDHIAELKIDGIRSIISRDQRTRVYTRHQNEITYSFQEVVSAVESAVEPGTILDGELVICNTETGKPDFAATMRRFQSTPKLKRTPGLTFVAFDILAYKGESTRSLPLMARKQLLEEAIQENDIIKRIRYMEHGFVPLFELCRQQGLEGIVLKQRNSLYHTGKRPKELWQRVVVYQREDCFITGYSKKEVAWTLGVLRNGQLAPAGTLKYASRILSERRYFRSC